MPLIPRDDKFFDLLRQMAGQIHGAAQRLVDLFDEMQARDVHVLDIKVVEQECDRLAAEILDRLGTSLVPPLDREDLYLLSNELLDLMGCIDDVALLTVRHEVRSSTGPSRQMSRLVLDSVLELEPAVALLEQQKGVRGQLERIRRLQEAGGRIRQEAVQHLFAGSQDALEVIRWSAVYDKLQATVERCGGVARALQTVHLKNS